MKKRRLDAVYEYDFSLLGIITGLKEYKLAWLLNNELEIHLTKERDIEIEFLKKPNLLVSNFLYETEHSCLRLLRNKSLDSGDGNLTFLLPELRRFDYIFTFRGFDENYTDKEVKDKISSLPGLQFAQFFSASDLKSRENLIF